MKLEYTEELNAVAALGIEKAKELGIDVKEDDFTIVQPYDDGQSITISVADEDGERTMKTVVNDSTIVLEKHKGTLDIFTG